MTCKKYWTEALFWSSRFNPFLAMQHVNLSLLSFSQLYTFKSFLSFNPCQSTVSLNRTETSKVTLISPFSKIHLWVNELFQSESEKIDSIFSIRDRRERHQLNVIFSRTFHLLCQPRNEPLCSVCKLIKNALQPAGTNCSAKS